MIVVEISVYLLVGSVVLMFAFGVWRFLSREDPIRLAPIAPPVTRPLPRSPASASTTLPASPASRSSTPSSPGSIRAATGLSYQPALEGQLQLLRDRLGGDVPEAVVLLATAAREELPVIAVPRLTRVLLGMGRSAETALQLLMQLDALGILELRPDISRATVGASHLCPRGWNGALLGVARLRIGDIEEPVNDVAAPASSPSVNAVTHAAGDEPELHHVATGASRTSCDLPIGQLAQGLVGGSRELGWTTHGPAATCIPCRRALGLPDRAAGDVDQDGATIVVETPPGSFKTLVSAGIGGRRQ